MFLDNYKEKKYRQRLLTLEDKYKIISSIFENEIITYLNRLKLVSEKNSHYKPYFENYYTQFQNIKEGLKKDCEMAIKSFEELINDNNFQGIKEIYNSNLDSLDSFEKSVYNLRDNLLHLFEKDNELRNKILKNKEKYRTIKETIYSNSSDISPLLSNTDILFTHIDELFEKFENHLTMMEFDKADEIVDLVENLVKGLLASFSLLPTYSVLLFNTIPQRIKDIENKIAFYQKQDYPMDIKYIQKTLNKINKELVFLQKQIQELNIKNVKAKTDAINLTLNSFSSLFEKEEKAREIYFEKKENIIDNSYKLKKEFLHIKSHFTSFTETYVIEQKYFDILTKLNTLLEEMLISKKFLDTSLTPNNKKPYSVINKLMETFIEKQEEFSKLFKKFKSYFFKLKPKTEELYNELIQNSLTLLELINLINDLNLKYFSEEYIIIYNKLTNELKEVYKILTTTPIDVIKASSLLESFQIELANIHNLQKNEIENLHHAESSFVYCNSLREDFESFKPTLILAEKNFYEGKYVDSLNKTLSLLKNVYPEKETNKQTNLKTK